MTKEVRKLRTRRNKRKAQKRRRKNFFMTLICLVCAMGIITGITTISAHENYETRIVTVESGDSLWGLVSENYTDNVNIRKVISQVKKINNLDSSHLDVGDSLIIPIYG